MGFRTKWNMHLKFKVFQFCIKVLCIFDALACRSSVVSWKMIMIGIWNGIVLPLNILSYRHNNK